MNKLIGLILLIVVAGANASVSDKTYTGKTFVSPGKSFYIVEVTCFLPKGMNVTVGIQIQSAGPPATAEVTEIAENLCNRLEANPSLIPEVVH